MPVSHKESLANNFGLQWRGGLGNRSVLSVRAKGNAGQPLTPGTWQLFVLESLAVDPLARTILLVTKSDPLSSALYSLPLTTTKNHESLRAEKIISLSVTYATAMDLSSDGRRLVIIVSMFGGVMLTRDTTKEKSRADASRNAITVLTLPQRRQGESVCFTLDGKSLLLNSEGQSQPLWRMDMQ